MQPNRSPASRFALVLAPLALMLAACSPAREPAPPSAPDSQPAKIADSAMDGVCDEKAAAAFVGQTASEELATRAKAQSGARGVRVIRPGMAVTLDHRPGRLNLHLDDAGRITRVSCG